MEKTGCMRQEAVFIREHKSLFFGALVVAEIDLVWGSALENRFACYLCSLSAVISGIFRVGFAFMFLVTGSVFCSGV